MEAAQDLLQMESSMVELELDGVSPLCSIELSRRILDEVNGVTKSREITLPHPDYEGEEYE